MKLTFFILEALAASIRAQKNSPSDDKHLIPETTTDRLPTTEMPFTKPSFSTEKKDDIKTGIISGLGTVTDSSLSTETKEVTGSPATEMPLFFQELIAVTSEFCAIE